MIVTVPDHLYRAYVDAYKSLAAVPDESLARTSALLNRIEIVEALVRAMRVVG